MPATSDLDSQNDDPVDSSAATPVVVGEALVDCFADRPPIVGGAPLNVAWNLTGLGHPVDFVTKLGCDPVAGSIRQAAKSWGLHDRFMSQTDSHPTGTVQVKMSEGQPSYDIVYPVAYDFIDAPDSLSNFDCSSDRILYLGSLAWRRPDSISILDAWIKTGMRRFVDINLRSPWINKDTIDKLATNAMTVKLNDEELASISSMSADDEPTITAAVETLRRRWQCETMLVTCGSDGAYVFADQTRHFCPAPPVQTLVDTVGAGDAFAAGVIDGLLNRMDWTVCLRRAVRLAARVCENAGATSRDRKLYELESKNDDDLRADRRKPNTG